ncbi:MAG: hypothetical protein IKD28_04865 [Clostridia bacterium]|nr:hypothetical protein [Clostridia bacterium]
MENQRNFPSRHKKPLLWKEKQANRPFFVELWKNTHNLPTPKKQLFHRLGAKEKPPNARGIWPFAFSTISTAPTNTVTKF